MARPVEPRYPRILGCLIIGEGLQWDFIHALRAGSVVVGFEYEADTTSIIEHSLRRNCDCGVSGV